MLKRRFHREAQAAAALNHPNIGAIHGVEETAEGRLFIVMPFYEGGTLKQAIAKGPLPISHAVSCATQIAEGLSHAHAMGVIHRDIKPANLMFAGDGTLKILDFGIAKIAGRAADPDRPGAGDARLHEPGAGGRRPSRPPHRPLGPGRRAPRDARWQAAILRRLPSSCSSARCASRTRLAIRSFRPEVPPGLEAVVTRLLQKDPGLRYPDADAVAAALRG